MRRPSRRGRRMRAVAASATGALLVVGLLAYDSGDISPPEPEPAAPIEAGSGDVSAFPMPGTRTISTQAELSFRGATDLGEVTVVGSSSGEHTGRLLAHSDGAGTSWVPDEQFDVGEEVTVRTDLDVRGADDGDYTLTVAEPGRRPELEEPPVTRAVTNAEEGEVPAELVRHFRSEPDLQPPLVEVSGPEAGTTTPPAGGADASPGLTAIGVKGGFGQKGPMLVDDAGEPVWFHPVDGTDARDVQVQTLHGEPVLTWWEGRQPIGYGYGHGVVVDQTYTEIARFDMASGYDADSHEILLTDSGTALMLAYEPVRMDTSHIGGWARGEVVDNVIQEIDLETGALLFEWHSVGQVALEESYLDESYLDVGDEPYDYFHLNSIDVDDDGDLLLSARHACAAYKIDRETGSLQWRLGGTDSDFTMGEGTTFLKQHDVRRTEDGTITLFDNGGTCGETTRERSRGIALRLDEAAMTAELAREVEHPDGLWSESQANYRELPGVGSHLGWGSLPRWSLLDPDGELLLDARMPEDLIVTSYRAQRVEWTGRPTTDPAAVLAGDAVHVSWNGATDVAAWRVVTSAGAEVASAPRDGFETAVAVGSDVSPAGLTVEALDAAGEVVGAAPVR
ncbi:arylsulfotransferase family protein [Georgenia alba]|uniref:Arylsulfotransferase family protein n=1 Tax=Georgenia alba TaxID=2233858 RepID=A0ABW2Q713_9MICO